jgi:O-antigen/teichoic acid export membrane protein
MSVALARIMGREAFGELGIIQSTVGMFGTLAGFGLGVTATKHIAELRESDPLRAGRILVLSRWFSIILSGAGAAILWLAAPWLAASTLAAPQLAGPLRISGILLLLSGVSGAQLGALAGLQAFRPMAMVNLAYAAATVPLALLGARFLGLDGVVLSLSAGMLVAYVLGDLALRRSCLRAGIPIRVPGWHGELGILWRFSLPAALSAALVGPVSWACATILVNQSNGYAEMGVFNAANQWFIGLMLMPTLVGQAVLPFMAEQVGARQGAGGLGMMRRMVSLNRLTMVPALALCIASPAIMATYGPGFAGRWLSLVLCILTAAVLAVLTPVGQLITARGMVWAGFTMNLGWAVIFVGATLVLAPQFGADGIAGARLLAYLVHGLGTFAFVSWLAGAER